MSEKTIYEALVAAGMTREGACGMMGNMGGESRMKSTAVEIGRTKLSDEEYTARVDNGVQNFVDGVGYGLCQWTFSTRKAGLLAFAKSRGVSIGDEAMQVQYAIKELRENPEFAYVWAVVTASHDLWQCTDVVCRLFERPAKNNVDDRYKWASIFYEELASDAVPIPPDPEPTAQKADPVVRMLQACMAHDCAWPETRIDGIKTPEFREAIVEYAAAVASC